MTFAGKKRFVIALFTWFSHDMTSQSCAVATNLCDAIQYLGKLDATIAQICFIQCEALTNIELQIIFENTSIIQLFSEFLSVCLFPLKSKTNRSNFFK
jgi:hypothetical protein